jgi:predicted RNase H-like HicB family nuclease
MTITLECAEEVEGRWLAEVPQLPGVHAYGTTRDAAAEQALAMLYRVLDDQRRLGVQGADTVEVYGRQSERRLSVARLDSTLS